MLTKEDNELITRVGPGTVMGNFMRQYWLPGLLSSEVPSPDSDPLRVRLLGEDLVAFRDTNGTVGLIQHNCPHRGASLFFGRNEEAGIRCVYHGWKFDVHGNCVDMPNEPAESDFKHKVQAVAYPTRERGGMVWVYMGPRSESDLPPLPSIEANMLPDDESAIFMSMRECNWLQGLEGDIDTSHFGFLHAGAIDPDEMPGGTFSKYVVNNRAPQYAVLNRDYGTMYGAYRPAEADSYYWRIAHFVFPFFTFTPPGPLGAKVSASCWVPIDDEHTHQIGFSKVVPGLNRGRRGDMLPRRPPPDCRSTVDAPLRPATTRAWHAERRAALAGLAFLVCAVPRRRPRHGDEASSTLNGAESRIPHCPISFELAIRGFDGALRVWNASAGTLLPAPRTARRYEGRARSGGPVHLRS
jgi:phthalate 4,5-dioxygenase